MKYCRKCDFLTCQDKCLFCRGELDEITHEEEIEIVARHAEQRKHKTTYTHNQSYTPRCPVCQSPNISKISTVNRAAHGFAFGLFSKTARSQWVCSNCGNKF